MIVRFPSGADTLSGALYLPEPHDRGPQTAGEPRPGVVVVHDVWGLYDQYHAVAQRLARAGFAALAVDLYARGEQPGSPADMPAVMKFLHRLPDRRVLTDLQAALDFLRARPEVAGRKLGLTGFCMGGKYADLAAVHCQGLSAAVSWYGMLHADALDDANPEHALDALARVRCPLLAVRRRRRADPAARRRRAALARARARAADRGRGLHRRGSRVRERLPARGLPRRGRRRRLAARNRLLRARAGEVIDHPTRIPRWAPSAAARGGARKRAKRARSEPKASEVN